MTLRMFSTVEHAILTRRRRHWHVQVFSYEVNILQQLAISRIKKPDPIRTLKSKA